MAQTPEFSPPLLRPYQLQLIKDLYGTLREGHRRVAIIAGTGAGKTVIAGKICADTRSRGMRLLFIVHLDVLVGQTYEKLQAFGLHCGFIKAGWKEDPDAPIQVASIQTMQKRRWWEQWHADIVLYDEAHTTIFSQVGQHLLYGSHRHAIHLALTATPYRLGKEQLGDHMETLVSSPIPAELQRLGYLAPVKYYGVGADGRADLSNVRTVAGDYDERDLKNACDRPELVQRIVEEWFRLTPDLRTIAFCVDIEHARHVAEAFRAANIPAATVEGGTPIKQRQQLYRDLRDGRILVLTSCNVISIGFDEPSVEVGLLLRPTQSRALHYQQIGRVMRISPHTGKTHGIILDQSGNLLRLGFPEDIDSYDLPKGEAANTVGTAPKKLCPICGSVVRASASDCPECQHHWEAPPALTNTSDLVELSINGLTVKTTDAIAQFHAMRRQAFQNKQNPNAAIQQFYSHYGVLPDDEWCVGSIFGRHPSIDDQYVYRTYLYERAKQDGRSISWILSEFQKEFGSAAIQALVARDC